MVGTRASLAPRPSPGSLAEALNVVVGVSAFAISGAISGVGAVARRTNVVTGPITHFVLRPPVLPRRYQPGTVLDDLARRGARQRVVTRDDVSRLLDVLVPLVTVEVLRRIDLTTAVTEYVDLDAVAARLDVDAVAARLDIDAVIDRMDLTRIVLEKVDLDAVVAGVDIDAIAARLDIDAVIARIDLVGIAQEVIDEIDLPEIIRESTGSMASETVRGVRMQGIAGDEALGRVVDRILLRRKARKTQARGLDDASEAFPEEPASKAEPSPTDVGPPL